jgi:hypothetical protein
MSNENLAEKMLNENPLLAFSVYTHIQVEIVRDLGRQILEILDNAFEPSVVGENSVNRAYGLFWLWVLGSYEITRTMSQAESCFSNALIVKLRSFKKSVSILRMPFAKQEYPNKKRPIQAEASIYGIDTETGDLKFEVRGKVVSMRSVVNEFESLFSSISRADILQRHELSY